MTATWHIRAATASDTQALIRCIDAAYKPYAERIPDLPAVSEGCAEEIAAQRVWVAVMGETTVIGGLFLLPQPDAMKLANVAVDRDHGSKGIGRALIAHAEQESIRQGYTVLTLNTHVAMPGNIAFYTRLGWTETARHGNTVSMRKDLREAGHV
ncbi:MAG: GNAT family N-acetyltransferase [Alphaproteobacteria bacterium]|jgi:GNAT superfamily N-acetyltransferase|nr:GNAT family N-acetyltransferase [Rhodospirillaceae bacterium]MBT6204264.1 GNAT family N-acetyltransferase [Rhodospirillaceae bacterium]MBT6509845.1 GNAT family N-acetyltransferase [Rhodospirillaceae bacterium]MBT7649063.1 GNAT family N-acetyltransferase [Rhodospirillaceae bacterium]MDG2483156.1 GNAT family N-acetyltransferase [Alphaproteobacteria bacterium]